SPGAIDHVVGTRTIDAIRKFQATILVHPDGLVEVDRKTERKLRRAFQLQKPTPRPANETTTKPADKPAISTEPHAERPHAERPHAEPSHAASPAGAANASANGSEPVAGDPGHRIAALHPALQVRARAILAEAQRRGLSVYIVEGLRSMKRQNELYEQGRTAPGKVVTWVKGGGSYHNYGLAIDVVFQGKEPWGEQHDWQALGQAGEAAGLEWGGRWKKADRPHFQIPGLTIAQLKAWHADGGMDNVWRHVDGDRGASGGQPVAEDYEEHHESPQPAEHATPPAPKPAHGTDEPRAANANAKLATNDKALQAVERFRVFIEEAAAKYGMNPNHMRAIMAVESKGDPNATSGAAFGLMQITRGTWEQMRRSDPELRRYSFEDNWRDPRINTLFGAAVLKSKAGSMDVSPSDESFAALAVTAYNAGEGTVKTAMALAKNAGSADPSKDFLRPEFLKPAIAKHNLHSYYMTNAQGKKRNKSGTEQEAIDLKYREITRYAPQVDRYLEQLDTTQRTS
ncbi:MAG TPA: transglycosylase SLT domain-containing protein, partial [Kofleriaceae bacterium]